MITVVLQDYELIVQGRHCHTFENGAKRKPRVTVTYPRKCEVSGGEGRRKTLRCFAHYIFIIIDPQNWYSDFRG